jgi:polar amino acid transport system permease protein
LLQEKKRYLKIFIIIWTEKVFNVLFKIIYLLENYGWSLLGGVLLTLKTWFMTVVISFFVGIPIGIICSDKIWIPLISHLISFVTFVFRGIPFFIQILIAYYVLPDYLGLNPSPIVAGTVSLGLCSASCVFQIARAGVNSIPIGQWESAYVLGYSNIQTLFYIIFPQMIKNIVPALATEFDQLLKSNAILATIGILELARVGKNIFVQGEDPALVYAVVAVMYLIISSAINVCLHKIEKSLNV